MRTRLIVIAGVLIQAAAGPAPGQANCAYFQEGVARYRANCQGFDGCAQLAAMTAMMNAECGATSSGLSAAVPVAPAVPSRPIVPAAPAVLSKPSISPGAGSQSPAGDAPEETSVQGQPCNFLTIYPEMQHAPGTKLCHGGKMYWCRQGSAGGYWDLIPTCPAVSGLQDAATHENNLTVYRRANDLVFPEK